MNMHDTRFAPADDHGPVPIGLPALARLAFDGCDLTPLWNRLVERVTANSNDATGHPVTDAKAILAAIEAGHVYSSIDGLAAPAAFQFTGRSGSHTASEGDILPLDGAVELRAQVNNPSATVVLFSGGHPMSRATGGDVTFHAPAQPGVYRIEVWLRNPAQGLPLPWIVSNPIYVRAPSPPPPPAPAAPAPRATYGLMPDTGTHGWRIERDTTSMAVLQRASAAGGAAAIDMRFTLGGTGREGQVRRGLPRRRARDGLLRPAGVPGDGHAATPGLGAAA